VNFNAEGVDHAAIWTRVARFPFHRLFNRYSTNWVTPIWNDRPSYTI